jgi:hypothetical protein
MVGTKNFSRLVGNSACFRIELYRDRPAFDWRLEPSRSMLCGAKWSPGAARGENSLEELQ